MKKHLIFYDHDCALCHRSVLYLLKIDTSHQFVFAPLGGVTAAEVLVGPNAKYTRANSLVLVEYFQSDQRNFWIRSQAIFRVYWLLGRRWIGCLHFLPVSWCDRAYQSVADHHHRLKFGCERPEFRGDRFLP